jgi:tripartite ATP-independent transporter DctM subunit
LNTNPVTVEKGEAPNLFRRFSAVFSQFTSLMNSVGTLWVFAIMFFICADIISTQGFNFPLRGVPELVAYSLVGAVYLQLAHSLHVGRFTRAEMFIEPLESKRPIAAAIFNTVFSLAGIFVFVLIANGGYIKFLEAWPDLRFGVEGEFTIIVWPLRVIILFGAAVVAIKYFILTVESLFRIKQQFAARAAAKEKEPVGWPYLGLLVAVIGVFFLVSQGEFDKVQVGALSLIGMLVLIFTGIHIGVALLVLGFVGIVIMMGDTRIALNAVKLASNEFLRNYFFGVVPLFVLMGLLVNESDIGKDTFNVARWGMRRIKGGLGIATVAANAVFAAITGSSIASAAVFTKVATPHMLNHGYTARFAVGTVAGSSVLGMLIPPSLLLIIYGFVAEQSVGILFLAAIIPGLILATAMGLAIIGMSHYWPSFVGNPTYDDLTDENLGSAAVKLLPIFVLIGLVLGGIYGGFFTPVEAGAVGAAGALIISTIKRRLTWAKLWKVLIETGHTTVSVLFLILAANIYGRMLALSGFPQALGEYIADANLGFYGFMTFYVIMVIILGMFLESISLKSHLLPHRDGDHRRNGPADAAARHRGLCGALDYR